MLRPGGRAAILALVLAVVTSARADEDSADNTTLEATLGWGALGFLTGFLAHESGHVVANLVLGNVPHPTGVTVLGFIPFFTIAPRITCVGDVCTDADGKPFGPGRHGKFAIVSAGFEVQHITDEILLRVMPDLRFRDRPYLKGLLAFNTLVSVLYSISDLVGAEADAGDVGGEARVSHVPKAVLAGFILAPALLDIYRYYRPGSAWAPWASVAAKAGTVGFTFTF